MTSRYDFRKEERADLRIIKKIFKIYGMSKPSKKLLEKMSNIYEIKGGSWVSFFNGDPNHIILLKKVVKSYLKAVKEKRNSK